VNIARKGGYLEVSLDDQFMFPRVTEDRAEEFFDDLCKRSPTGGATLVQRAIKRHFRADRVRYFATSSVGFFLDHSRRFNVDDFYNVIERPGESWMLRGEINPINVLEPLLWLAFSEVASDIAKHLRIHGLTLRRGADEVRAQSLHIGRNASCCPCRP
jgi:hypothetical protein